MERSGPVRKASLLRGGAMRKRSIFIKILVPTVLVMLLQTLIVGSVLFVNGTVRSVESSAVQTLQKNAENRSITLENLMVHSLSNLDKAALDITAGLGRYLNERGVTIDEALGSDTYTTEVLYEVSDAMIAALRLSASTGVFVYFVEPDADLHGAFQTNGLYYRDLDPILTPADMSDILYMRGFVDIARKDKIQLDSLWSEDFFFAPEHAVQWESFAAVLRAAREYPELSPADLAYWSPPHLITGDAASDVNECITYTRPLFFNGRLIAMLGTEMQVTQLKKYFPESDFGSTGQGGYMLVQSRGSAPSREGTMLVCGIHTVTGSYVKRMLAGRTELTLTAARESEIFTVQGTEPAHVALLPLRLYNAHTPASEQQWYLASIAMDSMLFGTVRSVITGVFSAAIIAIVVGTVLLAVTVRLSTRPLISIAEQIVQGGPADPIVITKSGTYETELLCSTINEMKDKRRAIEAALREERERYLLALESVTDTFLEYDTAHDRVISYHFSTAGLGEEPVTSVVHPFVKEVQAGRVAHPEDVQRLLAFLKGGEGDQLEMRVVAATFPAAPGTRPDDDYLWVFIKASHILDDGGNVAKIIGVAKNTTEQKREELARMEAERHDSTTGLYHRDYGLSLLHAGTRAAHAEGTAYAVCAIRVDEFDAFEARYGRTFGGVMLMHLGPLLTAAAEGGCAARLSNDEFFLFLPGAGRAEASARLGRLYEGLDGIYAGEDVDLRLSLSTGVALKDDAVRTGEEALNLAMRALQYGPRLQKGQTVYCEDVPPEALEEQTPPRERPVSVTLDITRESMVGFAFDLFEHTSDTASAIHALLGILGKTFALHQVLICSYDADFGANQVTFQWNAPTRAPYPGGIQKVTAEDFAAFTSLLDENGTLLYTSDTLAGQPDGLRRILCVPEGETVSALCCAMYESSAHVGRMLFLSADAARVWGETDRYSLYETAKIISAHMSIEKSNSASRAKSEFLSRMSHEIRTPMNAIIGMTRISKENVEDPERLMGYLNKIDVSAKHLLALINDVLEMSRIESGKMQITPSACSLHDFIASIDALVRPLIEEKQVQLKIAARLTHGNVVCDEYRLRQVMVNLLGNAAKFTEPGGVITLTVEEQSGAPCGNGLFHFSVRDTGVGIRREDQPYIFKAFEQAKEGGSAKKRNEGTGLGLAISSSIIAAMGSRIQLESEEGVGSDFFFTLSLKLSDETVAAAEALPKAQDYAARFADKKVLLVEDNEINLEIMSYILNEVGFKTDIAKNGEEAVHYFLASQPGYYDVILMDIQMPVMDGLTATREIRKNRNRPDAQTVPIIAMTANAFDEDTKKSIESGMNGHMAKPVDHLKLYAMLSGLLC